jgi:co-chaperonin GroES (HSP10)
MLQEIKMLPTDFQPLQEFMLIKPDATSNEEVTEGGFIITHQKSITMRPCSGVVLAKGPGCENIEVGDYVVFPDTDGIDVKFEDSDTLIDYSQFMLLRYKSVIGKKKSLG